MQTSVVLLARELLEVGSGGFKELLVHQFREDNTDQDDALQEGVRRNFLTNFDTVMAELTADFGEPTRSGIDDGRGDVPLCGIFRFAVWATGKGDLFLAAAHEDRECPYLLAVGTI